MIMFHYHEGSSVREGKIKLLHPHIPIEADIEADGWNFHIITGEHRDGRYICIPNWDTGSELAYLTDTFWNRERLSSHTKLGKANSDIIAAALAELSRSI